MERNNTFFQYWIPFRPKEEDEKFNIPSEVGLWTGFFSNSWNNHFGETEMVINEDTKTIEIVIPNIDTPIEEMIFDFTAKNKKYLLNQIVFPDYSDSIIFKEEVFKTNFKCLAHDFYDEKTSDKSLFFPFKYENDNLFGVIDSSEKHKLFPFLVFLNPTNEDIKD